MDSLLVFVETTDCLVIVGTVLVITGEVLGLAISLRDSCLSIDFC